MRKYYNVSCLSTETQHNTLGNITLKLCRNTINDTINDKINMQRDREISGIATL
jgi:hypothetical protein